MWALINNSKVIELLDSDPEGRFHPSITWVKLEEGEDIEIGDSYVDGEFSRPTMEIPASEVRAQKIALVQAHLDAAAQELNYDNITTAITYAEEPAVPKFQAEGQALRAWRSLVWEKCYQIMAEVDGGTRQIPDDEELIEELPILTIEEGE